MLAYGRRNRWCPSVAIGCVWAFCGALAPAQTSDCTTCNNFLTCDQGTTTFLQESGSGPTHFVGACGAGGASVPIWHATRFNFPAGTSLTHVCVALRNPRGAPGDPGTVFFANPDPANSGLPGTEFHSVNFTINPSGSFQMVSLNGSVGVSGTVWVGVKYPTAQCNTSHQGTAPGNPGAAGAVFIQGSGWQYYSAVGAAGYGSNVPVIRPLRVVQLGPAFLVVNTLGTPPFVTTESGGSFSFGVHLSRAPACDNVLVLASSTDTTEGTVNPSVLIFTPANWNVPQSVTVTGVDDPQVDGDINYGVELLLSSIDQCFHGQLSTLAAINHDNDAPTGNICPPPLLEWRGPLLAANAPPALVDHAMAYDSIRERVVLYGGVDAAGNFNGATWEWDGNAWQMVHSGGPGTPDPRVLHEMVFDSARGRVVLFGGVDFAGNTRDDTWEWDGVSWQLVASGINSPGGPRDFTAMAYDANRGVTVLFGGLPPVVETWEWDGINWTPVLTPNFPSPACGDRHMHAMTYDAVAQRVLLFGGLDCNGLNNDLWSYDGVDWTQLIPTSPLPQPRANPQLTHDLARGVTVLWGGDPLGFGGNETWEWDGTRWIQIAGPGGPPTQRTLHAMVYDAARCESVLFGGDTGGGVAPPDVWTYPRNSGASSRVFCIFGTATGAPWSWSIGGMTWNVEELNAPGVPAGSTADVITQAFVDSINAAGCCTLRAEVLAGAPTCFEISSSDPNGFDLCVGTAGAAPTCCLPPSSSCSFNPDIVEVQLSGADCNANGMDDAIDLLLDPALDSDGDGIIDSCQIVVGDLNCDGLVSVSDIGPFVLALTNPPDYAAQFPNCNIAAGDTNGDGIVSVSDIGPFVALLIGP